MPRAQAKTNSEAADVLRQRLYDRMDNPGKVWGIPWGDFPKLNEMTGGIKVGNESEIMMLAARPAVGKSALAGKWARQIAEWLLLNDPDKVVRMVLLEMRAEAYLNRIACAMARVGITRVRNGEVDVEEATRYFQALEYLSALPIEYLDGSASAVDLPMIRDFLSRGGNCAWWMVDPIGAISGVRGEYEASNTSVISKEMVQIAHRVAPGLLVHHLGRKSDEAKDHRPQYDHIAGSDGLVRDMELLMVLFRPDIYERWPDEQKDDVRPGELIIMKQREGATGSIDMIFDPTITDWAEDKEANRKATR